MDAGAVLYVGPEVRVVLDARWTWVTALERVTRELCESGGLGDAAASFEYLKDLIAGASPDVVVEELYDTGSVLDIADGVATVAGLRDVGSQEIVEFQGGVLGIAFSLMAERVGCVLLGPEEGIREGSDVRRTGHLFKVPVGEGMAGRIVNAVGRPVDGGVPLVARAHLPAERKAPGIVDRQPVDRPLHTGIKVIDALVPIGRGQRELVIGDRKIGKTTLAVDAILAQKGQGVTCVYCAIGQKASSVQRVVSTLAEHGALDYTVVVLAMPSEQPAFRYLAPYTACAIGEYQMDRGGDAFVVYDDLSKHAVTYREMSALLDRPVGREAYPGDIFYIHSRLLERAARMSVECGGGSLTALPIVETLAGDISAFIPTNVISICDGQIVLDAATFNEGTRPAMNAGLSVSRVGGAAQDRIMKQVAGRLRIDLAQYDEMAQFVKFGAEVDEATTRQLARGERARELLKQAQHAPMPVEHEALVLYAAVNGYFDPVDVAEVGRVEAELIEHADVQHPTVMASVRETPDLTPALETRLRELVESFPGLASGDSEPQGKAPATPEDGAAEASLAEGPLSAETGEAVA
ncbi:MAG: F0F1 ATP synthase subunit alpha [Actinobacteria bacterium]|nr:MAG: F0F1 ATP synthase subunit alpha [Actinomycetota bacterium]